MYNVRCTRLFEGALIDMKSREKLIVESSLKPVRVVAGKSAKRDGRDETKETRSHRFDAWAIAIAVQVVPM